MVIELLKHGHFKSKYRFWILTTISELGMLMNLLSFDLGHWKCKTWPCSYLAYLDSYFLEVLQRLIGVKLLGLSSPSWLNCNSQIKCSVHI